jgi:hypothetical protein
LRNYVRDSKPKEENKKNCQKCNKEIICKSNRQKFCDDCMKYIERERQRIKWHRYKKNYKKLPL